MMSPCQSCGACCARFEVTFYSEENVPEGYSYSTGLYTRALKSKIDGKGRPRCVALRGEIGCAVECGIYEQRPQPCRQFKHSFEDGGPREPRCDQARAAIGLDPLPKPDFQNPHLIGQA
jgi:hypothetical protein